METGGEIGADAPGLAIEGLTQWDGIAKVVEAFGGGWQAVAAISVIALCVTTIVLACAVVVYHRIDVRNRTKIRLAEIGIERKLGKRK